MDVAGADAAGVAVAGADAATVVVAGTVAAVGVAVGSDTGVAVTVAAVGDSGVAGPGVVPGSLLQPASANIAAITAIPSIKALAIFMVSL